MQRTSSPPTSHTHTLVAMTLAVVVLLLALALRIHLLGAQSFWNDEGNAYVQATRSFTEIADHAAHDIHPPGYYWLLAGWRLLVGETEFALRALSAFASVLAVAFAFALGKRLYGVAAGLAAALLVALNTFSIYYAQEARMYALLALWGVASMWALTRILMGHEAIAGARVRKVVLHALPLALINAAGLYTQYAYGYVLLAQGVIVLLWLVSVLARSRKADRPFSVFNTLAIYVTASLFALALFLPWLPVALQQIATWPNTGQTTPIFESLSVILNWLIFGITSQNASLAVAWLLLLFGLIQVRREQTWMALLPAVWMLISMGLFLAQGLFRPKNLKFLLPAQIGMALWIGRGVWVLWQGLSLRETRINRLKWLPTAWIARLAAIAAALTLVFALYQGLEPLYHDPDYQRADYRAIAARAKAELGANDAIILNGPNQAEVFDYYYDGAASVYGLPPGLGGDDAQTLAETEAALTGAHTIHAIFWGDAERDPNHVVEQTLDRQAYLLDDAWYGDVRLARYLQPGNMNARDLDVSFEQGIHLTGARWSDEGTSLAPGDAVLVALEWRAETVLSSRYKVFVQILYPDGTLAAQHDGEPVGNSLPTTTWQPDETIEDHHALHIPTDAPAGGYTLIVGLYAVDAPFERLLTNGGGDYVDIAKITVR